MPSLVVCPVWRCRRTGQPFPSLTSLWPHQSSGRPSTLAGGAQPSSSTSQDTSHHPPRTQTVSRTILEILSRRCLKVPGWKRVAECWMQRQRRKAGVSL